MAQTKMNSNILLQLQLSYNILVVLSITFKLLHRSITSTTIDAPTATYTVTSPHHTHIQC
jgi:hypothetical protein